MERRTAIISGGLGDVGVAIGKQLAEEGVRVIALYRTTPRGRAEELLAAFAPGNHEAILCDIRDESAVEDMFASVLQNHASLDICVHAAVSPILRKNILETSMAEFREQCEAALFGGFAFLKHAGIHMKQKNSGMIVGILSRAILPEVAHARMAGYVVAKYGLRGLLRELSQELASANVTVNALAPDFMDTALNADLPEEVRKFITERAVMGSLRSPHDVARAISFLASPEGKTVNGTIFSFDQKEVSPL